MNVIGYVEDGRIEIILDGVSMLVPDDMGNRHRQMVAEWEAAGGVIAAYEPPPAPAPTKSDVEAERDRRLARGFSYDFGDDRGVHRFGTTPNDMGGWDEVNKVADVRRRAGSTDPITISTETGVVEITPAEWDSILLASAAMRQPIWRASFTLAAMNPIPEDYAADTRWPPRQES